MSPVRETFVCKSQNTTWFLRNMQRYGKSYNLANATFFYYFPPSCNENAAILHRILRKLFIAYN